MIKLPAAVIVTGMEALTTALKEVQHLFDQGFHIAEEGAGRSMTAPQGASDTCTTAGYPADELQKEDQTMSDQDLGGDDLKYVSYSVLFTKRDYEATLKQQKEFLVNYATDGASFAALKMIEFAAEPFHRPPEWTRDNLYPPDIPAGNAMLTVSELPPDDRKYLTFIFNVERRLSRGDADYEKRTVKILGEIRDRL
jgi:hypothetical protein